MNIHFDINQTFTELEEQRRTGKLTTEDYQQRLRTMLLRHGKMLPPQSPQQPEPERSGGLSYGWQPDGRMSISFTTAWDGQCRFNNYPRHVRQTARLELEEKMTDAEVTKLAAARAAGEALYQAVTDDLLCQRAEAICQTQGPDTRRAINLDERFHLADNPDVILREDLRNLIDGAPREDDERDR